MRRPRFRTQAAALAAVALVGGGLVFAGGRADAATTAYEAESATITAGVVESNHAGYLGSGFVNTDNAVGSAVQWSPQAVAGSATLRFRFANGTTVNRPMRITVNGTDVSGAVTFAGTGAWTTWQEATVTATLRAGTNTVLATATTANGGPNLDRLTVVDGATTPPPTGVTPVAQNGQLRVCGVKLCNRYGQPIQLRGMSTHGLQWYPQCVNDASLDALAGDWGADHVRLSMYVQEGGYETNPRLFTDRMHTLIEQVSARGMYVIVDWHQLTPGDPNANLAMAKTFFTEIAQRHGSKPNILYDVANEPNETPWSRIKAYHEAIIPVVRAADPDAVILLGTHGWASLGVSDGGSETDIINNPVNATNIMYTFHFYAGSHGTEYLNTLSRAADRIPVFVTEFGTQTASGDGANNFTRSQQYLDLMAQKKISWTNWNYSDDSRSGAVFTPGTCPNGPYAGTSRLKPAGVWVRDHIRTPADNFPSS
ncbi:cellulase family glycosylhydrolase [Actinoplanes friuliensis]|uniref:cellulase n=1 Tax=Actinoplanes friuliensis DSM 7358 TaxID=1246995 RepID=U5W141_9ACTN|nr:cellulase family glycosylhydrolase [Actinoplanes friuliensis]AGZ42864.1 Endoglucanase celA precursor [Actinoplanes friuliensis DSM 7358]